LDQLTIAGAVESAAELLEENAVEESRRTAQLLMMHLLKIEMAELISRGGEELSADLQAQYSGFIHRRLQREPLQYITRRADFWSREFYVDPRAPIPRPETEHIIEEVQGDFPDKQAKLTIADVGVGSGILAVVMALEFPKAKVFGIDRAPGALEVATINSSRLNVSDRFKLMQGDLLEPLIRTLGPGSLNVIVSNPPYINDKEAADLAPEIISFEPKDALIAGPTGLEVFKRLVPQVALMLAPGGRLYLECGSGQAEDVAALIGAQEPLAHLRTVADLQGIGRVIVGEKKD